MGFIKQKWGALLLALPESRGPNESVDDSRPVTVKLFHDAAHPSVLRVPIGD
jgi:hypothetical protein